MPNSSNVNFFLNYNLNIKKKILNVFHVRKLVMQLRIVKFKIVENETIAMQFNIATKNNKLHVNIVIVEDGNDNTCI